MIRPVDETKIKLGSIVILDYSHLATCFSASCSPHKKSPIHISFKVSLMKGMSLLFLSSHIVFIVVCLV